MVILSPITKASYSASLLDVGKENQRAYSRVASSGETRIILVVLTDEVEDLSMYKVHDGISNVGSSASSLIEVSCLTSSSSSGNVHSTIKLVRI